jgi:hypothetical protein
MIHKLIHVKRGLGLHVMELTNAYKINAHLDFCALVTNAMANVSKEIVAA